MNVDQKTQTALAVISSEGTEIVDYLKTVEIVTAEAYAAGAEQLVEVKRRVKDLEKTKADLLAPLKLAQKQISALVDKPLKTWQQAEAIMKAALTAFDERREEEAIKQMQDAARLSDEGEDDESLAILNNIAVTPDVQGVSFRTTLDFEVTDLSRVPVRYVQINRTAVLATLREGLEIPGVQVVMRRSMAVRS